MSEIRISVLVLLGLPGAGKTTFSQYLLSLKEARPFTVAHVCYDKFFKFPLNGTDAASIDYKNQRCQIFEVIETLVATIRKYKTETVELHIDDKIKVSIDSLSSDYLIICDDNHYYRSMRHKLFQFCQRQNLAYAQIYLTCNLALSLCRNKARGASEKLPSKLIERMSIRFEPPQPHTWEALTLNLTDLNFRYDTFMPFLRQSFAQTQKQVAVDKTEKSLQLKYSTIHQADLLMRNRIGELLLLEKTAKAKQDRAFALNTKRKEILKELQLKQINSNVNEDMYKFVKLLQ